MLFQGATRYCSVQVYWCPLCWCRDPAEAEEYDFLLDVRSSHVSPSLHTSLQILCSAVEHTGEGSPASPPSDHRKSITPVLLGELGRDGSKLTGPQMFVFNGLMVLFCAFQRRDKQIFIGWFLS